MVTNILVFIHFKSDFSHIIVRIQEYYFEKLYDYNRIESTYFDIKILNC